MSGPEEMQRQIHPEGCLRAAVASLLGRKQLDLPDLPRREGDWWEPWVELIAEATGYELLSLSPPERLPRGLWVASVNPAGTDRLHAVLMLGDRVLHDPEWRDPILTVAREEIQAVIYAVPLNPREARRR